MPNQCINHLILKIKKKNQRKKNLSIFTRNMQKETLG